MTGGRGGLLGALLGAAVIFLIENLLGALGLSSFWSQAVYGATLIVAVVFAALSVARSRARGNSARRRPPDRDGHWRAPRSLIMLADGPGPGSLSDNSNKRASATGDGAGPGEAGAGRKEAGR
jgi:hypothetical protein